MICACGAAVIPVGALAVWADDVHHGERECRRDPAGDPVPMCVRCGEHPADPYRTVCWRCSYR